MSANLLPHSLSLLLSVCADILFATFFLGVFFDIVRPLLWRSSWVAFPLCGRKVLLLTVSYHSSNHLGYMAEPYEPFLLLFFFADVIRGQVKRFIDFSTAFAPEVA